MHDDTTPMSYFAGFVASTSRSALRRSGALSLLVLLGAGLAQAQHVTTPEELDAAIEAAQPGDVITMANGTWTDVDVHFDTDGVEGDSIYLRAETPGQVVLDGRSRLRIAGNYLVVDGLRFEGGALDGGHVIQFRGDAGDHAHHSRLTQAAVVDYNPADRLTEYKWVSLYGTHNRVDHSYFAGKSHDGATLVVWLEDPPNDRPNYHRIDHNHFGHRPVLGKNGGETIRVGTSHRSMQDSRTLVEHNLFERCNGEHEIISNKSGENVYRHNTFVGSQGALTLRHGNRATVEGNFFFGDGERWSGGVRVIGEGHRIVNNYFQDLQGTNTTAAMPFMNGVPDSPLNRYFQVRDVLVAFNTFVNCRHPFLFGVGADPELSLPPRDVTFANNVVISDDETPVITVIDDPVGLVWKGNVMHGTVLGIARPDGIRWQDPALAPGADGLWRPGPGSPVLGAAVGDYPSVDTDVDGQPRTAHPTDAGADARADAPICFRPLTPADVGPAWMRAGPPAGGE